MSNTTVPSWVMLFEHNDYSGRHFTRLFGSNVTNMHDVSSDDGKKDFNDKASSAMYCIAIGATCRLWQDKDFKGQHRDLKGTGQLEQIDLKAEGFNDKTSALQWLD